MTGAARMRNLGQRLSRTPPCFRSCGKYSNVSPTRPREPAMRQDKLVLPLLALMLAATPAAAQSIQIGLSTPVTGPAAVASEWERWGVDLALEEINAAGGLLGRKVEVITHDNKCNPAEGVNV